MFTIFCDETGNSGSRFFTPEQPVYAQGGWYVQKDRRSELEQAVLELERKHGYNPQSKGTRIKDSPAGRHYLAVVLERISRQATPFFYLVEKRYFICAKAVETYFDPAYNPVVEMDEIRDPDARKQRAELLYVASDDILVAFADAFRAQDCGAIVAVGVRWADALGTSGQKGLAMQLRYGLSFLRKNLENEFSTYNKMGLPKCWDALNVPSFAQAAQLIEQAGLPCELVHDECATMEASFRFFFAQYSDARRRIVTRPDGSVEIFGFRCLQSLSFGNSEALPLLRAADYLLAGCVGFTKLASENEPAPKELRDLAAHGLSRMMHIALGIEPPLSAVDQVGEIMASDIWIKKVALQFGSPTK
jgi:hypothetical protein